MRRLQELENLIENENTFEVDGNEVTIDFKEESDRADRDEEAQKMSII